MKKILGFLLLLIITISGCSTGDVKVVSHKDEENPSHTSDSTEVEDTPESVTLLFKRYDELNKVIADGSTYTIASKGTIGSDSITSTFVYDTASKKYNVSFVISLSEGDITFKYKTAPGSSDYSDLTIELAGQSITESEFKSVDGSQDVLDDLPRGTYADSLLSTFTSSGELFQSDISDYLTEEDLELAGLDVSEITGGYEYELTGSFSYELFDDEKKISVVYDDSQLSTVGYDSLTYTITY